MSRSNRCPDKLVAQNSRCPDLTPGLVFITLPNTGSRKSHGLRDAIIMTDAFNFQATEGGPDIKKKCSHVQVQLICQHFCINKSHSAGPGRFQPELLARVNLHNIYLDVLGRT